MKKHIQTSSETPFRGRFHNELGFWKKPNVESQSLSLSNIGNENSEKVFHRYHSEDLTKILFLSKRGMSRGPLARELMREVLKKSSYFGRIRPLSRGVSPAYDQCPLDKRMHSHCQKFGFALNGTSRFATIADLTSAEIIITLDSESEDFTLSHLEFIRGVVKPLGIFLCSGNTPFVPDPFERDDEISVDDRYDEIFEMIQLGCKKLLYALPALL